MDQPQRQTNRTPSPANTVRSGFVGRQREMAALQAVLEEATSGQGRLVMLAGEPGIGKTRTAQELASHAETLGAQVLWGWCYEQEGAPPYWPWVQPIRSYIQRTSAEALRSEMGPGAADIAEVISEVRAKLPALEPPPPLEPEQARFRLFDSTTTFLKKAAESQPLLLVLDDLHWADKPSLLLLQFLARQLGGCPMLVVGTYRDVEVSRQHPLSETLAQLSRLPVFMRLELKGLGREDTADFIQNATGVRPRPQVAEAVYSHTEGNPFFMGQVVRLLSERAELASAEVSSPEDIGIPSGVREAIGQRLNRLSARCNETLSMASAIGRGFDFRLLRALSPQVSEDQLLGVIDEALEAHLIEGLPGGVERYQFSHALVQQTLSEALSASRRVRQHARIAESLEELYGADVEAHAAELAYHFGQAAPLLGTDKLVHYSLLAGERALAAYAWEEAQAHFQRGLTAKEGQSMDGQMAAILFGLGRCQILQSTSSSYAQVSRLYVLLTRAFDYYVELGEVARAVAVAGYPTGTSDMVLKEAGPLISRAVALVSADSYEAGRLLSRYGEVLGRVRNDYAGALDAFERALVIARREGDTVLEMRILANAAGVDFFRSRYRESETKCLRVIDIARDTQDLHAEIGARGYAAWALDCIGESERARQHAAAMLPLAERLQDQWWLFNALWLHQMMYCLEGNWDAAREYADRGLAVAPTNPRLLGTRVLLEYEVGDFAQGEVFMQRLLDSRRLNPPGPNSHHSVPALVVPMVSRITGRGELFNIVEEVASASLSSPVAYPLHLAAIRSGLGLLSAIREDGETASEQYVALEPLQGTMLNIVIAPAVDRILGLLSVTMGLVDQAKIHFEEALTFCRRAGYRPELAWTCHDYAEALLVGAALRGRPGHPHRGAPTDPANRAKAMSLLHEALAISTELGMRPLMKRVGALREGVASGPAAAPAYPDGLTHREVEVLRLIAAGKTDREIAEELIISVRTVGNHVSNILNKTDTSNRTGAATYAARHGLV